MKKIVLFIILHTIAWADESTVQLHSLESLTEYMISNNKDVVNSKYEYFTSSVKQRSFDGYFSPEISVSSDFGFLGQKEFFEKNNTLSTSFVYNKKIISGSSIKTVTNYSLYTDSMAKAKYIQNPSLSLVFSQSLGAYWLQGKKNDPVKEQFALQEKYAYFKYECSKILAIQNLIECLFNIKICNTKSKYFQNQIKLCNIKLESLKKMHKNGSIDVNEEITTGKDILECSENFESTKITMENYIKTLLNLCNLTNFNFAYVEINYDRYIEYLKESILNEDFFESYMNEKFLILENNRTIEKQDNSAIFNIGATASLKGNKENFFQNLDYYPDSKKIIMTISMDLSPWLSSLTKKNTVLYEEQVKEYKIEYMCYKNQKRSIIDYYENLISEFESQKYMLTDLLEQEIMFLEDINLQYKKGAVSELDFIKVKFEVENLKLKKEELELNLLLYKILLVLNNPK